MKTDVALSKLRSNRAALERLGVVSASLFGSAARGDATPDSDVDVAIVLDAKRTPRGFAYFSHLDEVERTLQQILGAPVDVVPEPAPKPRIQQAIDRDRAHAF